MKVPVTWNMTGDRIDWNAIRDRIDLARVATAILGPAPGRRGERGRRLWWRCPFHEDKNPSLGIDPGKPWWRCYGCGEHGDAANLVVRINKVAFPEAVRIIAELSGIVVPSGGSPRPRPPARPTASKPEKPASPPPEEPSGLPLDEASTLVTEAAGCLWTPEGAKALAYLRGRGLNDETIKAARLGVTPGVMIPTREGDRSWSVRGITIPWFDRDRLTLVKFRRPPGSEPKYVEGFRDRPRVYPTFDAIEPGRPLVICEGELDALLLAQALGDLAVVVTLGSASTRPNPSTLGVMLAAAPWFIATDADEAGDKAASGWPARATRVRPPKGKDWTEAAQAGIDLRRWWSDRLGGTEAPAPSEERVFVASGIDGTMTVQSQTALPSEGQPDPEPRLPYWTAPNLDDDDVAALEAILSVPAGTPWPPLGGIIEEGHRHNATVPANLERKTRP